MKKLLIITCISLFLANSAAAQNWSRTAIEGGSLTFRSIDLDEADQEVKAGRGQVYGWFLHNSAGGTRHFKFYDDLAANINISTATPKLTISLPAGASANLTIDPGIEFTTGITVACVTGVADNSTGAPGANECVANIFYR